MKLKGIFAAAVAGLWLLGAACASQAATFSVTTGANEGAGSLRQAIQDANANNEDDTVNIAASVREISISRTIDITGGVTINGGGATIRGARTSRLFSISGGTVRFDRLTFSDGYPLSESGGAVYIDSTAAKAHFVNCTFFGNRAGGSGGAVYVYGGGVDATTFTGCTLTGNEAAVSGGAVAVYGGVVQFVASIVTGNVAPTDADVHTDLNGVILNSGQYNVIGQTNAGVSFASAFHNTVSVSPESVFKTPGELTTVDGVQVLPLLSATSNVALDLIPSANALNLPPVDQRGVSRPQMTAIDAGAYELSPVGLASIDLIGGSYVQRGTTEKYRVQVWPEDATLDVRNYEDGIEWTVGNPAVVSVDRAGNVTGLANGQTTLRATAHGWNSKGTVMTATDLVNVRVGDDPLPAPTVAVTFANPKITMSRGSQQTLKLNLSIEPKDTPYTVSFTSTDPVAATVMQSGSSAVTAIVKALNAGETTIHVTVTAENSKGQAFDSDEFLLTVIEHSDSSSGGGGGGCNGGFGVLALALPGLLIPKSRRR